jgi:hypothetical protein
LGISPRVIPEILKLGQEITRNTLEAVGIGNK